MANYSTNPYRMHFYSPHSTRETYLRSLSFLYDLAYCNLIYDNRLHWSEDKPTVLWHLPVTVSQTHTLLHSQELSCILLAKRKKETVYLRRKESVCSDCQATVLGQQRMTAVWVISSHTSEVAGRDDPVSSMSLRSSSLLCLKGVSVCWTPHV